MAELKAGPLTTTWLPEHGMVGASLTHDGEELLGQRGGLDAYVAKGSAFGIPLLAPWANRLDGLRYGDVTIDPQTVKTDGNGLPKDGTLATRAWTVAEATRTRLVATLDPDEHVRQSFPFDHAWKVTVALTNDTLVVDTTLSSTGEDEVPIAFGWHPLFTLPGCPRSELHVEVPAATETPLDDRGIPRGDARATTFEDGRLGEQEADSEHRDLDGDFVLAGGGRELTVSFGPPSYPVGHLWAPAGEDFVAWEPMTAPTNALVTGEGLRFVPPGGSFTARFLVTVGRDED